MTDDSRLGVFPGLKAPSPGRVAAAAFRRVGGKILVTGDEGGHAVLSPEDFELYLSGKLPKDGALTKELQAQGLDREYLDFASLVERAKVRHLLDWPGPNVHTVVVTLRCNLKCAYCHASVVDPSKTEYDMSLETAKKTVDFVFSTPNPELMLEFQGGEPLLNWPVVRFISAYARRRADWSGRKLHIGLISNFSLLDEEKVRELARHKVSFCTSLDGPEELHDKNRIWLGGNAHAEAVRWIRRLQELRAEGLKVDVPNAICTVTRHSFPYARAIVDQLADLGLQRVQLGPLDPIGFARRSWDKIGYEPEEFVEFYKQAVGRIFELNRKGVKVYEKMGLIFLLRILEGKHWRFPNGDGLCRLAYNHDGGIYTSEEGRLLANEGDASFRIGAVGDSLYTDVLDHPTLRASVMAQHLPAQPLCSQCAYKPYCTVLPVSNYGTQGSLFGRMPENLWCRTLMGVFDFIFERLQDPEDRKLLEGWLEHRDR